MLRLLGLFLLFVTLAAILIGFMGASLPLAHTATRTVMVPASPERVWTLISHVQDYPHWRTGIKSVQQLPDIDGHAAWQEKSQMGEIPQELTESEAPTHRVVTIADPELPFGGSWTFDLVPQNNGATTQLTIREDGTIRNVFFRFMQRYIFGYDGTITQFENDLVKAAG
jgi:uncharacterized protein YndB with AHSA1/START domain